MHPFCLDSLPDTLEAIDTILATGLTYAFKSEPLTQGEINDLFAFMVKAKVRVERMMSANKKVE